MSEHAVKIITIAAVNEHPNADKLEIIPIGGWQAVSQKGNFKPGDRAIYIEPDYVVPLDREEFAFLKKKPEQTVHRLRAVRLRQALSFGLLIKVPEALSHKDVGDNVMEDLGIVRYEPVMNLRRGSGATDADALPKEDWPKVYCPKFDLENLQNHMYAFIPGEPVIMTEKIHGTNARYVCVDGIMYSGSRNRWLKPDSDNLWTRVLAATPAIRNFCEKQDGFILYGEIFGPVQSMMYGRTVPEFNAFAVLTSAGEYLDWFHMASLALSHGIPTAPIIYEGPYNFAELKEQIEEDSIVSNLKNDLMEGGVIVPLKERFHALLGRVSCKLISNRYWESNNS